MRTGIAIALLLCGCGASTEDTAAVSGADSLEDVVAKPLSEKAVLAAAAVIADLPPDSRPRFEPALHDIPTEGRRGRDLADAYRRQFRDALNVAEQSGRWRDDPDIEEACRRHGTSVEDLALTLMRVGCAHHAGEVGGRTDLGAIRAKTKTEIASLCDQIDTAKDELARRTLCSSLTSAVALDTYLTLLDRVPAESERLVDSRAEELANVLPRRTAMDIRPVVR